MKCLIKGGRKDPTLGVLKAIPKRVRLQAWIRKTGVQEPGARSQESGVQEFRSSGVQEFRSSGVQEFRSSGVQEFAER
jgi:hypothetical protein